MAGEWEVILWRAPSPSCPDPAREVKEGFDAQLYPGNGPYFATHELVARDFQKCYRKGIQEIHIPGPLFDTLVRQGVIEPDDFFPEGQSWHVPAKGLPDFNAVVAQGTANRYQPED